MKRGRGSRGQGEGEARRVAMPEDRAEEGAGGEQRLPCITPRTMRSFLLPSSSSLNHARQRGVHLGWHTPVPIGSPVGRRGGHVAKVPKGLYCTCSRKC